ncbi:hypothetical protein NW765_016458 [Fusarium oxysporum]|nr:hypothetical protein NW765_016458 [Fusarium oxysporum]
MWGFERDTAYDVRYQEFIHHVYVSRRCHQSARGFPKPFPNIPNNVVEQLRLNGKVLVVNGAADGLGYSVAEGYAEAGGNVALWYNSNEAAIEKARLLSEQHGIKASAYKVDVSDSQQIQDALKAVLDDFGKIDVYVANAGEHFPYYRARTSLRELRNI